MELDKSYVKKIGSKWYVFSKTGKKLSKGYPSEKEAKKRLKQIEYFKNKGEEKVEKRITEEKAQEWLSKKIKDEAKNVEGNYEFMAQYKSRTLFYTKPEGDDGHTHMIIINNTTEDGVSTVDGDKPHAHEVKEGKIQKAEGHIHKIALTEGVYIGILKKVKYGY